MSDLRCHEQFESGEQPLVFRKNQSCPLGCRSASIKLCETYGSGRFEGELFTIWQFEHCDLGLTDPIPTEETSRLLCETRDSNDFRPNDSKLVSALKAFAARHDARKVNVIGCEYGFWLFCLGILLQPLQVAIGAATGTSVCLRICAQAKA